MILQIIVIKINLILNGKVINKSLVNKKIVIKMKKIQISLYVILKKNDMILRINLINILINKRDMNNVKITNKKIYLDLMNILIVFLMIFKNLIKE